MPVEKKNRSRQIRSETLDVCERIAMVCMRLTFVAFSLIFNWILDNAVEGTGFCFYVDIDKKFVYLYSHHYMWYNAFLFIT